MGVRHAIKLCSLGSSTLTKPILVFSPTVLSAVRFGSNCSFYIVSNMKSSQRPSGHTSKV